MLAEEDSQFWILRSQQLGRCGEIGFNDTVATCRKSLRGRRKRRNAGRNLSRRFALTGVERLVR